MRFNTERFLLTALALLGAGALSVAVADPASAPAPAASTPAAPAANAAAAADTKSTASATQAATQAAEEKRLLAAGYKPEMRNGVKFWCRTEKQLGSNLAGHKVCATQEQIVTNTRDSQDSLDVAQRHSGQPTGR